MKISFCHYGDEKMASYRYRCLIPAKELGAEINNPKADVLIFAKPLDQDVPYVLKARNDRRTIIADFCDMHFHLNYYDLILKTADAVTCPTEWFAEQIRQQFGIEAHVVPDPFEYDEVEPHCAGYRLLWFGQALNIDSLERVNTLIAGYPLAIVSNLDGAIPWSRESLLAEMSKADIVVMPETAPYKSPNRTVESIRRGCFVVAEPHPAINNIPGIWIGNIKEGIEWAKHNPQEANERTRLAQAYVRKWFSPKTQADAWRTVIQKAQSSSISAAVTCTGTDG
jgi:glycosyltransferase involved in cell wall biosynthesis